MFITGEAWSTTMYWYMEHSGAPRYLVAFFFVSMFTWLNCVIFSLFVAVLLINFSIDEEEMLPKQRVKYEFEQSLQPAQGSKLLRLLRKQEEHVNLGDEDELHHKASSYELLLEANLIRSTMSKSIDVQSASKRGIEQEENESAQVDSLSSFSEQQQADGDRELQLSERVLGGDM